MRRPPMFLLALAALAALAAPARADWPNTPGVSVPVAVGPSSVANPATVPDGEGGAIVLWVDDRYGTKDIFGQRLNAAGAPLWAAGGVVVLGGPGAQQDIVAAADGEGGVVFAYSDDNFGLGPDVCVFRVDRNGYAVWYPLVLWSGPGIQRPVAVSRLSNGNFSITHSTDNAGSYDIVSFIVAPNGGYVGGTFVCTADGNQYAAASVADAAGGVYVVWTDYRASGGNNIFAQRLSATAAPQWAYDGIPVSSSGYGNNGVTATSDGSGGLVALWNDYDGSYRQVVAKRLAANGAGLTGVVWLSSSPVNAYVTTAMPDGAGGYWATWLEVSSIPPYNSSVRLGRFSPSSSPYWPALALSNFGYAQDGTLAEDGEGGVFVAWVDVASAAASWDLFAEQVTAEGGMLGGWYHTTWSNAAAAQLPPKLAADGRGGVIGAWMDRREYDAGNLYDIYAGRVAPFARLGNPEPAIVSVSDVPNDQGGRVKVRWNRSYLDKATSQQLTHYALWREVPEAAAQAALARGARLATPADAESPRDGERVIRRYAAGAWAGWWEYVAQQSAQGFASYSLTVATTSDSVPGAFPRTRFMVQAASNSGHWESAPDSGYSVDNLGPAQPAPFAAVFGGASSALHWAANREADLAAYRLYRGNSPGFVPDGSTFVAEVADTQFVDAVAQPYWYKLVAVDAHGNVSPAALAAASALLDAAPAESRLALSRPSPNPARGPVTLRFALASAGPARLAVLDAQGRLVRTLAEGERAAGTHAIAWDRLDANGARVAPGLYFVRLQAGGRNLVERFVALD